MISNSIEEDTGVQRAFLSMQKVSYARSWKKKHDLSLAQTSLGLSQRSLVSDCVIWLSIESTEQEPTI